MNKDELIVTQEQIIKNLQKEMDYLEERIKELEAQQLEAVTSKN